MKDDISRALSYTTANGFGRQCDLEIFLMQNFEMHLVIQVLTKSNGLAIEFMQVF